MPALSGAFFRSQPKSWRRGKQVLDGQTPACTGTPAETVGDLQAGSGRAVGGHCCVYYRQAAGRWTTGGNWLVGADEWLHSRVNFLEKPAAKDQVFS